MIFRFKSNHTCNVCGEKHTREIVTSEDNGVVVDSWFIDEGVCKKETRTGVINDKPGKLFNERSEIIEYEDSNVKESEHRVLCSQCGERHIDLTYIHIHKNREKDNKSTFTGLYSATDCFTTTSNNCKDTKPVIEPITVVPMKERKQNKPPTCSACGLAGHTKRSFNCKKHKCYKET